jgi:hypothetical protein
MGFPKRKNKCIQIQVLALSPATWTWLNYIAQLSFLFLQRLMQNISLFLDPMTVPWHADYENLLRITKI